MLSKQILNISILALFIAMAIFGLHASMMTDRSGDMSNCPLINGISSICPMNVFEHINTWLSLFTTVTPATILLFFAFALLFVSPLSESPGYINSRGNISSLYRRQNLAFRPFDYLRIILGKGILHPKVFGLVSASR